MNLKARKKEEEEIGKEGGRRKEGGKKMKKERDSMKLPLKVCGSRPITYSNEIRCRLAR